MRPLADDVADAVLALEELMFACKRDRPAVLTFTVMLAGFERARGVLDSPAQPSREMLEDLLVKTQDALGLVRAESARNPQSSNLASLELEALIEAVGARLSTMPASADAGAQRELPALLLS